MARGEHTQLKDSTWPDPCDPVVDLRPKVADPEAIVGPLPCPDWHWQPEAMTPDGAGLERSEVANDTRFGRGLKLFHDGSAQAVRVTQNEGAQGRALHLETTAFEGGFLSLVMDVPQEARLTQDHILGVHAQVALARSAPIHVRLNLTAGPNTECAVQEICPGACLVEFDLSHMGLGYHPVARAWVDLIFDDLGTNGLTLSDLMLTRRPAPPF